MRQFYIFIAVLVFGACLTSNVNAQQILEDFKKPLPEMELLPQEEWEAKSTLYEDVPFDDEDLAYKIRIPNNWTKVTDGGMSTFQVSNKVFGEIARFYGPPRLLGERSSMRIQILELDYQQTAEQWFLQHLLSRGYNVQAMDSYGEEKVEALYVFIKNQVSYIVRAYVQIIGKRVILSEHLMPIDFWSDEKIEQAQIISSFEFKDADLEVVEEMKKYLFLDVAEMVYPVSWELRAPPLRSIDYMGAKLLNISNVKTERKKLILDGKIEINLVSVFAAESLEGELEKVKDNIQESGVILGDSIENLTDFTFNEGFDFAKVEVFEAQDKDNESIKYEIWLSVMSSGDYYYFVSLLSPSRDDDYYTWVRNSQTFRLVNEQFNPFEESIIDR